MDRVNAIYRNETFRRLLNDIADRERDREFCRHGLSHLLDVARIAVIIAADRHEDIARDIIYAAALMHDIGRAESDNSHALESAKLCNSILPACGYNDDEIEYIASAIERHGDGGEGLADILHTADKLSRICSECAVSDKCKWDKINTEITL